MVFKDLLLALTSYPMPTPTSAIDQAIAFAELVGARISAVTFEMELPGRSASTRMPCWTSRTGSRPNSRRAP